MSEIYLHRNKIESVFELLGDKENDITYSIGWALARNKEFSKALISKFIPHAKKIPLVEISLQENKNGGGITDIEMRSEPDFHIIVEAKRGWTLPGKIQLQKYARRLKKLNCKYKALIAMSECSKEYATHHLIKRIGNMPVQHMSWKEIDTLLLNLKGTHTEKRLISELRTYLRRVISMEIWNSNMVYVVPLAHGTPKWSKISWQDIVNKKRRYFQPANKVKFLQKPTNYLGFRYEGKLQSIRHVESREIVADVHKYIREIQKGVLRNYYLYKLGPAIKPAKMIKSGDVFGPGSNWAALDLLLTSKTIAQARDLTKKRERRAD